MSGLLLSAQIAIAPPLIGMVTGLIIFVQIVRDMLGIAIFAAVYVNELRSKLHGLSLSDTDVGTVLDDVQLVHKDFSADISEAIVRTYAHSLRNGWWLMFACACGCAAFRLASVQHKFK